MKWTKEQVINTTYAADILMKTWRCVHHQIQLFKHAHIHTNFASTHKRHTRNVNFCHWCAKNTLVNSKKYHSQAIKHEQYLLLLPRHDLSNQPGRQVPNAIKISHTSTYQH